VRFAAASVLVAMLAASGPAAALDEPADEMPKLKACEKRLCTMILDRKPIGDDLSCDVQKTWAKKTLEGGEEKGVSWGFGDARCFANITLSRADIVGALTKPKHTIKIPPQQVKCILEREGEVKPLTARLSPKLVFKDGKADKVWINLEEIDGPADVKSTIWTAAKLEDTIGIFHRPLIRSINKFINVQCAKRYGPGAQAKADSKTVKKDRKAAKTDGGAAKADPKEPPATAPPKDKASAGAP
jgi:hypothetical protein